jgi:hypothetical protein
MSRAQRIVLIGVIGTLLFSVGTRSIHAQETQSLSVTPPLFQIGTKRGDIWPSTIKVVNNNPYPLSIYTEVVDFAAQGEKGQGRFIIPETNTRDPLLFSSWIEIARGPFFIEPEQAVNIPFFVAIPNDAPPGGHYAAVLVTTEPPKNEPGSLAVQTSQAVTSLFFLRVDGDVDERGDIREFRPLSAFVQKPDVAFKLRFENKGNVHLQPKGNIVISNMWGTERGSIPVNYQTHFGNVLPQSIREFTFSWQSRLSITDIGRYKAVASLGYGEDGSQTASAVTYFWVIPVKITLVTLLVIGGFVSLIVWMVRRYVRRMLILAGIDPDRKNDDASHDRRSEFSKVDLRTSVSAPIRSGVLDLRRKLDTVEESFDVIRTITQFVIQYRVFFVSLFLLILMFVAAALYIGKATEEGVGYRVIITDGDHETTIETAATDK